MNLFDQEGNLDSDVQDALSELGNVGVGMASITIGRILGVRVELEAPNVVPAGTVSRQTLPDDIGRNNIGILMKFAEPLNGFVLCVLKRGFVYDVVEKMTGCRYEGEKLYKDEIAFSAAVEFANMLSAAYMKAVGKYTGMRIFVSPYMMVAEGEQISIGDIPNDGGMDSQKAILVETRFQLLEEGEDKTRAAGKIVMLPDDDTVGLLMEALGM